MENQPKSLSDIRETYANAKEIASGLKHWSENAQVALYADHVGYLLDYIDSTPASLVVGETTTEEWIRKAWNDGCNCMANHAGYNMLFLGAADNMAGDNMRENLRGKRPKELWDSCNEFVAKATVALASTQHPTPTGVPVLGEGQTAEVGVLTIGDPEAGSTLDFFLSENLHHETKEPMMAAQAYGKENSLVAGAWFTRTDAEKLYTQIGKFLGRGTAAWVSVKDKLPERGLYVLIYLKAGGMTTARLKQYFQGELYWAAGNEVEYPLGFVSNWQELPAAPHPQNTQEGQSHA